MEIITVQHRPAGELLPVITALLRENESASAMDFRLIIRAGPGSLRDIRELIARLDRPPRRLLITVKYLSATAAQTHLSQVEGGIDVRGDDASARANVRVRDTHSRDGGEQQQRVQVIEGGQAFIEVGKLLPFSDYRIEKDSGRLLFEQETRFLKTGSGFYARPRLRGDTVTVEISPQISRAQPNTSPPVLHTQSLTTTVSGKLGEWILLGGSLRAERAEQSGSIVRSTASREQEDKQIVLRVTELE